MSTIAIVIVAYNRLESIKRLVRSILKADYLGDVVDLVISIDNSGTDHVVKYSQAIDWPHGQKKIITYDKRLGLKEHVLRCGDLTNIYDSICVFEDDLFASPGFYAYAKAAINHFKNSQDVAGISLYSYEWNQYVDRPFSPIEDKYDVFLLQIASSWGQIWERERWSSFRAWMKNKSDADLYCDGMPRSVSDWSSKSWLKFHNCYLVDSGKFFVYPRFSLATNFSDPGEHASISTTYQVPLLLDIQTKFRFPENTNLLHKYDAFFENKDLAETLGIESEDLGVSLYGNRPLKKRYVLTTELLNFKLIKSFGIKMRPIEVNVILDVPGTGIYLYDTAQHQKVQGRRLFSNIERFLFEVRSQSKNEFLLAACFFYARAIKRRLDIFIRFFKRRPTY